MGIKFNALDTFKDVAQVQAVKKFVDDFKPFDERLLMS